MMALKSALPQPGIAYSARSLVKIFLFYAIVHIVESIKEIVHWIQTQKA